MHVHPNQQINNLIVYCLIYFHDRINSGWVSGKTNTPDMAIVELNRRVDFVPEMVGPICVPPTEMFDDRPKDAYVAGK